MRRVVVPTEPIPVVLDAATTGMTATTTEPVRRAPVRQVIYLPPDTLVTHVYGSIGEKPRPLYRETRGDMTAPLACTVRLPDGRTGRVEGWHDEVRRLRAKLASMRPTWLHRLPTLDEVAAHAQAHPGNVGVDGICVGRWLCSDKHNGHGQVTLFWVGVAPAGTDVDRGIIDVVIRPAETSLVVYWTGDVWAPLDALGVGRCMPCTPDGLPACLAKEEP